MKTYYFQWGLLITSASIIIFIDSRFITYRPCFDYISLYLINQQNMLWKNVCMMFKNTKFSYRLPLSFPKILCIRKYYIISLVG